MYVKVCDQNDYCNLILILIRQSRNHANTNLNKKEKDCELERK